MRKCKIDIELETLNIKRGKVYPQIGHLQYADIRGDGRRPTKRYVYEIFSEGGGVSYSSLNGHTPRATLHKIRAAIQEHDNAHKKA